MGLHLTVEQRRRVRQLRSDGLTVPDVAREIGCSLRSGQACDRRARQARGSARSAGALVSGASRCGNGRRSASGSARRLLRRHRTPPSPIHLDDLPGGERQRRKGPLPGLAGTRSGLRARTTTEAGQARLPAPRRTGDNLAGAWWSPEEIARRLLIEFPDDPIMRGPTRRSTRASTSRGGASCTGSWPVACEPGGPSAGLATAWRPAGASRAWS